MSNWTHVAGIIRVDAIRDILNAKINFDEIIGKECRWNSPNEIWEDVEANPDKYLPMGSEGSLQMSVWENPDKNCMASYTISIFGDLRDHHSTSDIIEWFKKKCGLLWVRNAVITVENEWYGTVTYTYTKSEE